MTDEHGEIRRLNDLIAAMMKKHDAGVAHDWRMIVTLREENATLRAQLAAAIDKSPPEPAPSDADLRAQLAAEKDILARQRKYTAEATARAEAAEERLRDACDALREVQKDVARAARNDVIWPSTLHQIRMVVGPHYPSKETNEQAVSPMKAAELVRAKCVSIASHWADSLKGGAVVSLRQVEAAIACLDLDALIAGKDRS